MGVWNKSGPDAPAECVAISSFRAKSRGGGLPIAELDAGAYARLFRRCAWYVLAGALAFAVLSVPGWVLGGARGLFALPVVGLVIAWLAFARACSCRTRWLLAGVLPVLFRRNTALLWRAQEALGAESYEELAGLKGLLLCLAWYRRVVLDGQFSPMDEPGALFVKLWRKAALLEIAQYLLSGDMKN